MKKVLFFSLALSLALLTNSCGLDKQWFSVDNPTKEAITITIDGETVTIEAEECKRMEDISKGEHTLKIGDVEEKFTIDNGTYLNPTKAIYVSVKVPYGNVFIPDSLEQTITIDNKKYTGPFQIIEGDLMIDHSRVNFGPATPLKDEVSSTKGGVIMTKIFRKDDFIKFYKEEY